MFEVRLEYNGAVNFAIIKGLEKGRSEGIIDVAKNELKEGLDIELVVKITGFSKEEILELKESK